jgi:dihydrofolate reductase
MSGKILVYCGVSLDGFIAGVGDDLSWLDDTDSDPAVEPGTVEYSAFMEQIGALLMGRRTYDMVMGFDVAWPYGSTPVFVATSRPLQDAPSTVIACSGDIHDLCEQARQSAGTQDVYIDGGDIISQALDADCVDEMILSVVPVLLGKGVPLYNGNQLHRFGAQSLGRYGTTMQTKLTKKP